MILLSLVPLPYRILIGFVAFLAVFLSGWVMGLRHDQRRIDAMVSKAATEGIRIAKGRDIVTTKIERVYVPQIERARVITETIVKEVPVYVSPADPDLSPGFRVYHDAAAAGRVPDPAAIAHATAVPAQAIAETMAENYGQCRQDQLRLSALQDWVRQQQKVR